MHGSSMSRLVACAVPLVLVACGSITPPGSTVPAALAVPSGNTFAFTLKGTGLQNYECRARPEAAGAHDWVFVSPEAALHDSGGALVGRHYGGPTWEHGDGSKVVGKVLANAPAPGAGNIPWLLLQGTATGTGAFKGVTYVQRVETSGGVAPAEPCSAAVVGKKAAVRYAADYRFYKG